MEPIQNTASVSPEEAFVGVDPDATEVVKVGAARITVRVLPSGLWDILTAGDTKLFQESLRKSIARLAAAGRDPNEPAFPDDPASKVTLLDIETMNNKAFLLERTASQLEVIRFGVVGMEGVAVRKNGQVVPVELKTEEVSIEGMKFQALAKETLRLFEVNRALRDPVHLGITKLNQLGDFAKKA